MNLFWRIISWIATFGCFIAGTFTGTNGGDFISKYKETVKSVPYYKNTLDTAVAQIEIYDIIKNYFESESSNGKTKKVIVIGYDGCRADALSLINDNEISAIRSLSDEGEVLLSYCGGVPYPKINTQATSTAPGWCSMLTGEWADVHGVTDNSIPKSNEHLTLLTTAVEENIIDSSAFYVSWGGHFSDEDSTYINEKRYVEEKNLNVTFLCANDDSGTYANVVNDLSRENCSDFIFSIFEFCDHVGHNDTFNISDEDYKEAFYDSEAVAANIIDKIKSRATYESEDWLIILASDHGGYNNWHGGPTIQERYTFLATNKKIVF